MHTHNLVCFLEKERKAPRWQGSSALRSQAQTSKAQSPRANLSSASSHPCGSTCKLSVCLSERGVPFPLGCTRSP